MSTLTAPLLSLLSLCRALGLWLAARGWLLAIVGCLVVGVLVGFMEPSLWAGAIGATLLGLMPGRTTPAGG